MSIVPNASSNNYSIAAFGIGLVLSEGLSAAEQNSLGNWFMLIGQTLCTKAAQQQVLNNRNNTSNNSNSHIVNDNLRKSAERIKKEVNNLFTSH